MATTNGHKKNIVRLLDTGAIGKIGALIKRNALASILHTIQQVDGRNQGQYALETSKEVATFNIKLPKLCRPKTMNISMYVEDNAKGCHDIVLRIKYCSLLGLSFNFRNNIMTWDGVSMKMRQCGELKSAMITVIHPGDAYLPPFVKTEFTWQDKSITDNAYDKHNYRKPISLTLKPGAKLFCTCTYTVPMAIKCIARDKIKKLCELDVLGCGSNSPWGAPCLFQAKKNGGIQFLTNLHKLNNCIDHCPYPVPNIKDIIWKMQGFTYATCFDINRGYYHFLLDNFAQ
eukprot:12106900-Ditylum_brightwellii.AAC.1